MRSKLCFIIAFICLFLSNCNKTKSAPEQIDYIAFSYYNGLRIPFNEVVITMERDNEKAVIVIHSKPLNNDPKWNYSKIDTVLFTNIRTFDTLAKSLISLDKINIVKAHVTGLDGYSCKIEYGAMGKNKSYTFWSPDTDTKKRGLSKFLKLCEEILDISKLKKKDILK